MGLATHALALALGYALGNPEGRAKLVALRGRAGEAAKQASARPEVKQAREKAWDLAGEAGAKAKNRLTSGSRQEAAKGASTPEPSKVDTSASDSPEYGTPSTTAPAYGVPASGPGSNSPSGPGTSGTSTSGTGTFGTTAPKSGTASSDQASKPAASKPAPTKSASGTASATNGTTDTGDDRLAGTTVAEDSKAAVLGLPTPDVDRPDPTKNR